METPTTMHALFPYLLALHQQELLEQAENRRRAKLATSSQPSLPAWRRTLGVALTSAAQRLDPTIEVDRSVVLSNGSGTDLLPAC